MKKNKSVFRIIKYFFRCKKATFYACLMCVLGLIVGIVTPICNKYIQEDIIPNKNNDKILYFLLTFSSFTALKKATY